MENSKQSSIFSTLQQIGRSFMLPIALLPAAGILLGIGGSFSNPETIIAFPILNHVILQSIFKVMASAGSVVFANLALLFSIGVAVGLAKSDKGTAGLAAAISFLIMHQVINIILSLTGHIVDAKSMEAAGQGMVLGIQSLQMGVFGGMIVGGMTVVLHNKFCKIQLPQFLAFFGGSRFVPIIAAFSAMILGAIMVVIWPPIQHVIKMLGNLVIISGYFGTFLYGFIERSLIPFGLHPVFYVPFWQTSIGGVMEVGGKVVSGAQNIFFAQLADGSNQPFYIGSARFMAGKFPFMMFGLPAACLAMYHCALPENKNKVKGLFFSAALTTFLTGITEPIEFSFLFVAPFLYVIHCCFAGLSFMLMHIFHVTVGQTFSGGFIDFMLFGPLQGEARTHWMYIPLVGVFYSFIYYFGFRFVILKFNLQTPGRESSNEGAENKKIKGDDLAVAVIEALGGASNIINLDACITRLRVKVVNAAIVNEEQLKALGSAGVMKIGDGLQIIFGTQSDVIKQNMLAIMNKE
ncbi:glucose-specific PTS transporter subunit IIBC [Rickettsiales bacterium LUAb2]